MPTATTNYPDHVIAALKAELQKPLESKYKLVYLVIKLRNLIDGHKTPPDYTALQLFLSWPTHSELNKGWAQKPLDYFHANCETLLGWQAPTEAQLEEAQRLFSFADAHAQLLELIRSTGLARYSRLFQPSGWSEFMKRYVEEVSTTPLVIRAAPSAASANCAAKFGADSCAKRVTISIDKHEVLPEGGSILRILWSFKLKNGLVKAVVGAIHFKPDFEFRGGRGHVPPNI